MSLDAWQTALRRQFIPPRPLEVTRLDGHPVFTDYLVHNPESKRSYKVALRDTQGLMNYCECLDFRTSRLGTCKHIEAVMRSARSKRGNKSLLKIGWTPPYSSLYLSYQGERQVRLRIGTDHAEAYAALASTYFDQNLVLTDAAFDRIEHFISAARAISGDFRCYDDALTFILDTRAAIGRKARIALAYADDTTIAGLLRARLYPYQAAGIRFAASSGRCLLADDMGLGKTLQAIGAALLLRKVSGIAKVLVVCPTSLKYQWQSEIQRFTDQTSRVIAGNLPTRERHYMGDEFFKIVSYHTIGRDLPAITAMAPDLVILDEAQRIKNWKTQLARNVKRIESPHAIVLTGTPLENKLEELYSVVEFVDHYALGPFHRFLAEHQIKDETGKVVGYQGLHGIAALLAPLCLRRTRKEVLNQLPERIDKPVYVPLTARQRDMHAEYAENVSRLVLKWRRMGFLSEKDRQGLLINLNLMRMVCDSTFIVDQDHQKRHDTKLDELASLLDEVLVDPDQKVVVFSQWERMNRLVVRDLEARGIGYRFLHGGVPSAERPELFTAFNSDPDCRVFVSTDAGSTGLNLQAASILVNLDLPWNPAVLEQRIARIHRMGQKRTVMVVNFISADSIESRMLRLLGFKTDLAQGILDAGDDVIFMGDDKYSHFMNAVAELTATHTADGTDTIPGGADTIPGGADTIPGGADTRDSGADTSDGDVDTRDRAANSGDGSTDTRDGAAYQPTRTEPATIEDEGEAAELAGTAPATRPDSGSQNSGTADSAMSDAGGQDASLRMVAGGQDASLRMAAAGQDASLRMAAAGQDASLRMAAAGHPAADTGTAGEPAELLMRGVTWLAELSRALATPGAAEQFAKVLTTTDEASGQSYLKIPVPDAASAAQAMAVLARLLSGH
jgi:superfamily II DNA or RNA helicase